MSSWEILGSIILIFITGMFGWYIIERFGSLLLNIVLAIVGLILIVSWPGNAFAWFFGLLFLIIGGFNIWNMITTGNEEKLKTVAALKEKYKGDN